MKRILSSKQGDHYMRALLACNRHRARLRELNLIYARNDMERKIIIVKVVVFHQLVYEFTQSRTI